MKISVVGAKHMLSPFTDEVHNAQYDPRFDPKRICYTFRLPMSYAEKLASAATWWMEFLESADMLKPESVVRLKACTMRFSNWQSVSFQKNGKPCTWNRTRRHCNMVRICPWCRQAGIMRLYSHLMTVSDGDRLFYIQRTGETADMKTIFRAPNGGIDGSVRNLRFSDQVNDYLCHIAFFSRKRLNSNAKPCTKVDLYNLISSIGGWDLMRMIQDGWLKNYLMRTDKLNIFRANG